ncbi:MAG: hypothetical protein HQL41_18615, partial [Alphaproteobacteria bacterium]|nr:hypothetical protein [Alphaproteobacteria bacterium]
MNVDAAPQLTCGIVMPISAIDGCSADHWNEVKSIISDSIESIDALKFSVKLVSDSDDVGIIQKRIVQNVYSSDIIVCDVSGKNPNVMFELGMRLAFDKPTVIIKDDKTDYSFDTGVVEHIPYPRDLRFGKIVSFRAHLADKVLATYRAASADPDHSTFLKSFGRFQIAGLSQDTVPADKMVVEMLTDLQSEMARMRRQLAKERPSRPSDMETNAFIIRAVAKYVKENPSVQLDSLVGDSSLENYVAKEIEGARHFKSHIDFREAME